MAFDEKDEANVSKAEPKLVRRITQAYLEQPDDLDEREPSEEFDEDTEEDDQDEDSNLKRRRGKR